MTCFSRFLSLASAFSARVVACLRASESSCAVLVVVEALDLAVERSCSKAVMWDCTEVMVSSNWTMRCC